MRHRALSWLSTLVFRGERGCTAGEGSGWACQVSQTSQRALGTLPEHWVHLLPACLGTSQLQNWGWLIITSQEGLPGAVCLGGGSYILIWNWDI